MSFVAKDVAVQLVELVRGPLEQLERRNRALGDQAMRGASSILLNILEGNQRKGGDRAHLFRVAKGSVEELDGALLIAVSWGLIEEPTEVRQLLDRLGRLLYGLVRAQSKASSRSKSSSIGPTD